MIDLNKAVHAVKTGPIIGSKQESVDFHIEQF